MFRIFTVRMKMYWVMSLANHTMHMKSDPTKQKHRLIWEYVELLRASIFLILLFYALSHWLIIIFIVKVCK